MGEIFSFGEWVRRRRRALDLTQEALAQLVGCAVVSIRKFESDQHRPSRAMAERLARHLQLPADEHPLFVQYARGQHAGPPELPTLAPAINPLPRATTLPTPSAGNLPVRISSFVGREIEQHELLELLKRPDLRLLTLTGPGGAGKTSLAIRVAASLAAEYPDGVWFVDLAPVGDPSQVAPTILQSLGIPERAQVPVMTLLQEWLISKRLLLLLDNFEQVLDAAPLIRILLQAAPGVDVLVTSRAPLQLRGEHEYPVIALALPPAPRTPALPSGQVGEGAAPMIDLAQYAACALFLERARAVVPSLALTAANAAAIAEICIRLDGLPLAIELAAPRLRLFSPEALHDRLLASGALAILAGTARDVPSRQQTIRATIAWSYNLLGPSEQAIFMRLGVFVGGWTLVAAEALCADLGTDVVEVLATLVERNLVRAVYSIGDPRFTMLETLRDYALEQLREAGLLEIAQERHAEHYYWVIEQMKRAINTRDERLWTDRVDAEPDNIRAVYRWATSHGRREFAKRLNLGLYHFHSVRRSSVIELRHWITVTLALPVEGDIEPYAPQTEAQALGYAGNAALVQDDYESAVSCFRDELRIATALGDPVSTTAAHLGIGYTALLSGDLDRASQHLEQALAIARAAGNWAQAGDALCCLGEVALASSEYDQAQTYLESALSEFLALGDLRNAFNAQLVLGSVLRMQHNLHAARVMYDQAFQIQQQMNFTYPVDQALDGAAGLAVEAGDPVRAGRLFGAAHAIRLEAGRAIRGNLEASYTADVARARSQISSQRWQEAWAAGMAMSLDEAVKYALGS